MSAPTPKDGLREALDAFEEAIREEVRSAHYVEYRRSSHYVAFRKECRQDVDAKVADLIAQRDAAEAKFNADRARLITQREAVCAQRDDAEAERDEFERQIEALDQKLRVLASHGSCACSYDRPGDVCAHHSPALSAAEARADRFAAAAADMQARALAAEGEVKKARTEGAEAMREVVLAAIDPDFDGLAAAIRSLPVPETQEASDDR